jgi:hypothetical protein
MLFYLAYSASGKRRKGEFTKNTKIPIRIAETAESTLAQT